MTIRKVLNTDDYISLFNYLSDVEKAIVSDFGTFIIMCKKGRSYVAISDDKIVGCLG